ncbi:HNH endonuclease signature motif containing protein [Paenibacillus sp. FSL R5-0519]|uniref:HNH endonuclease signature motif containing protein n=1 Tax=Paenibacillus sp. FSL R5-0519 TaxID=2921648 RepID=UPI0030DBC04C
MAWYTPEQKKFIHDIAQGRYNSEIAELFQAEFGIEVSAGQMKSFKANHKIKSNVPRKRTTGDEGLFTREQKEFIEKNVEGRQNQELADLVNEKFDLQITAKQMNTYKANHDLVSGLDCRFQKGLIPKNKGTKGMYSAGGNHTSFKKGHRPLNYMEVGSERINTDGYAEIKIADPNKWRGKHLIVWEKHHGREVPKGHVVLFGDGNRINLDPDNLVLVSRGQLAIMNKRGLIHKDVELTRTGVIMADIIKKISDRRRKRK